jgi:hypothetical protein
MAFDLYGQRTSAKEDRSVDQTGEAFWNRARAHIGSIIDEIQAQVFRRRRSGL